MKSQILDEAEAELAHAARKYESARHGLGELFLEQYLESLEQIEKHPRRFPRYDVPRQREIRGA